MKKPIRKSRLTGTGRKPGMFIEVSNKNVNPRALARIEHKNMMATEKSWLFIKIFIMA